MIQEIEPYKYDNTYKLEEIQDDDYVFIFDKNEEDERKISYFIREKNNKEMSPDQIKKYLSFKAIELLQEKKGERS